MTQNIHANPYQSVHESVAQSSSKKHYNNVRYVGFGLRLFATFVDVILLSSFLRLFFNYLAVPFFSEENFIRNTLVGFFIVAGYYVLFWKYLGATPGKMLFCIGIVTTEGKTLGWKHALLRFLGYILNNLTIFMGYLGYLWILFDKKKQGFHDKISGTLVIRQ